MIVTREENARPVKAWLGTTEGLGGSNPRPEGCPLCEGELMYTYTVAYIAPGCVFWELFMCKAENADHAEEQCLNAYPGGDVAWIFEGLPSEF